MDLAIGLLKLCGDGLIRCRQKFNELTRVTLRIQSTFGALTKLLNDRANEARLQGTIQDDLVKQLRTINAIIDEILDKRTTKTGKAGLFCGTCFGKGAAGYIDQLAEQDDILRDLLSFADSEVLVAQASALEEMAGGAAGKRLVHAGTRKFWREQFKNEMSVSIDKFFGGFERYEAQTNFLLQERGESVLACLRGRLDANLDGEVTLTELNSFVEACNVSPEVDFFGVVAGAAIAGPLSASVISGHTTPITAAAVKGNLVVTGDSDGVIKVWKSASPALNRLQVVASFVGLPITCLHFQHCNQANSARLLAAAGSVIVNINPFSGQRLSVLRRPDSNRVMSMASDDAFLLTATQAVHVWRRGEFDTKYSLYGMVGFPSYDYSVVKAIGDGENAVLLAVDQKAQIWNFKTGAPMATVQCSTQNVVRIASDPNKKEFFVGIINEKFWEVFDGGNFAGAAKSKQELALAHARDLVNCDCNAFQQIRFAAGGRIIFGRVNPNRTQPAEANSVSGCPVGCTLTGVYAGEGTDVRVVVTWQIGPKVSGMSVLLPPPQVANITISTVSLLGHSFPKTVAAVSDALCKAWLVPVVFRKSGLFAQSGRAHHASGKPNEGECAFVSALRSNTIHIWNCDLEKVGELCLEMSPARLSGQVTAVTVDHNDIFIGTLDGKLARFHLHAAAQQASGKDSAYQPLRDPAARRQELHAKHIVNVVQEFKQASLRLIQVCTLKDQWSSPLLQAARPICATLRQLPRAAQELCTPVEKFFALNPPDRFVAAKADSLKAVIESLDPVKATVDDCSYSNTGTVTGGSLAECLCDIDSWTPAVTTRLLANDIHCTGCQVPLTTDEERFLGECQRCVVGKRHTSTRICGSCDRYAVAPGCLLCEHCHVLSTKRGILAPFHILCMNATTLLVAAHDTENLDDRSNRGQLLLMERESLRIRSRVPRSYVVAGDNCIKVTAFDRLFADPLCLVSVGAKTMAFFETKLDVPLADQLVLPCTFGKYPTAMAVAADPPIVDESTGAISVNIVVILSDKTGTPLVVKITATPPPTSSSSNGAARQRPTLSFDSKAYDVKWLTPVDCNVVFPFPGGFFTGKPTGDVLMYTVDSTGKSYAVAGSLHNHNAGGRAGSMLLHPMGDTFVTTSSDGTMARWPVTLFKSADVAAAAVYVRPNWLLPNTIFDADCLWREEGSDHAPWQSLEFGTAAAEQALMEGATLLVRISHRGDMYQVVWDGQRQVAVATAVVPHGGVGAAVDLRMVTVHYSGPSFELQELACVSLAKGPNGQATFVFNGIESRGAAIADRSQSATPDICYLCAYLALCSGVMSLQVFARDSDNKSTAVSDPVLVDSSKAGSMLWIALFPDALDKAPGGKFEIAEVAGAGGECAPSFAWFSYFHGDTPRRLFPRIVVTRNPATSPSNSSFSPASPKTASPAMTSASGSFAPAAKNWTMPFRTTANTS